MLGFSLDVIIDAIKTWITVMFNQFTAARQIELQGPCLRSNRSTTAEREPDDRVRNGDDVQ